MSRLESAPELMPGRIYIDRQRGGFYAAYTSRGKRKAHRTATRREASDWLERTAAEFSAATAPLDIESLIDARRAIGMLPPGMTLTDAVSRVVGQSAEPVTVSHAVGAYLDHKDERQLREKYTRELRRQLGRLTKAHGCRMMDAMQATDLAPLCTGGPVSRNNYRVAFVSFWRWAISRRMATGNPAALLPVAMHDDKPPGILTPRQAAGLLAVAPAQCIPYLALGLFAGLRSAEIMRLDWRDIDMRRRHITVGAAAAKTRERRIVGMVDALHAFLAPQQADSGAIWPQSGITLDRRRRALWRAAGLDGWPHNAMRHSFASYRLADTGDAGKTATELGHGDVSTLYRHYREAVTPQAARQYFAIRPSNCRKTAAKAAL